MAPGPCRRRPLQLALLLLFSLPLGLPAQPLQVTGRMILEPGKGLAGGRIEIFPAAEGYADAVRRLQGGPRPAPVASAPVAADGSFRLAAPARGCFRVVVRAEGRLPMELPLLPLVEDVELPPLFLVAPSSLEVRVVGSDSRPVPGIAVDLESEIPLKLLPDLGEPLHWRAAGRSGVSGADGRLTLPWAPGELPRLTVLSPRFLGQGMAVPRGEKAATLRLALHPAARIEVRDPADRPAAGALIRWQGRPVALTGPRGRMEIAAPAGDPLEVESAAGEWARLVPRPGTGLIPVRLELRRRIAGKLVDQAGWRPVAGGLVWSGRPPVAAAFSGDDGSFQLDLPPGDAWVEAAAAGFLPGARRFLRKGAGDPLLLKLSPAGAVAGVVVDPAGRPLAAVQVELSQRGEGRFSFESVRTAADGRFRFPGLPAGEVYPLTATREGFAPATATARTPFHGRPASPVRIVMSAGRTAFGRLAGEDGRPVAGAVVALIRPLDRYGAADSQARSDSEGRFELRHLVPGTFDLIAEHPQHARLHAEGIEIPSGSPTVDLGRLTLPDGVAVEGRVTNARGAPIAGARVQADFDDRADAYPLSPGGEPRGAVQTGPDGRFRIDGLRRGALYGLAASREGYAPAAAPGVRAPTAAPVQIEMREARGLAVQVVGPEGEPVAEARLSRTKEIRIGNSSQGSAWDLGATDAEGRFRVADLSPGRMDLAVEAQGYLSRRIAGVQIPEDRDPDPLRIVLERGAVLDVRVRGVEGEPVPDVWVNAFALNPPGGSRIISNPIPHGTTDAEGRCRISLEPGGYDVRAAVQDRPVAARVAVTPGTTAVELRLPPGAEVSGRVVGEDGLGIAGVLVSLEGGAAPSEILTQPRGSFHFSGVPDGTYRLTAREMRSGMLAGRAADPLEVTLAERSLRGLELRLSGRTEGVRLTGRLLGLAPEEIAQAQVSASLAGEISHAGRIDPAGAYRVDNLRPGAWSVFASLPSGRTAQATVTIDPDVPEASQDLQFTSGVTLSGHVRVDGAPLAGAQVQVQSADGSRSDRTAYDGGFALRDLPPGPMTLLIGDSEGIGASRQLQLTESREILVEIPTGRLAGKVVAANGDPVGEARVEIEGWVKDLQVPFTSLSAQSGESGLFEVPRLGAGTYRIMVEKPGFAPAEVQAVVQPGAESTVEVRLAPRSSP